MANNSPQVSQLRAFQDMANNSPQARQATQLQVMADNSTSKKEHPIQKKANNTGLPDNLKAGMENLSGISLDDVKVHRNSDKPVQLNAHAYAQGTDIHLASGQEKHLPHEAWHVVQQKQGRVKPTMQMNGKVNVNDDAGLEKEADVMGSKATQISNSHNIKSSHNKRHNTNSTVQMHKPQKVVQLASKGEINEEIEASYNQTVAMFPGNEGTPITKIFSRAELIKAIVGMGYSGKRKDFRELMESMRNNAWCVAAWVHSGGLGGAAGGADPEPHITLMVGGNGIHVRVKTGSNLILKNAKGVGLTARGPQDSNAVSPYPNFVDQGLKLAGQKKADAYQKNNPGATIARAVAYVKSGTPEESRYNKPPRQLRYHAETGLFGIYDTSGAGSWIRDIQANNKQRAMFLEV